MINLISFIVGFISGVIAITLMAYFYSKKAIAKFQKEYNILEQELDNILSSFKEKTKVQERLNKVKNITARQLELFARADGPQKNALDGKYKNSLIAEINELEEEKYKILNSILEDNLDPEIVALDKSNKIKTMKLSEYMALVYPTKSSKEMINNKKRKFTLYYGGKHSVENNDTSSSKGDN